MHFYYFSIFLVNGFHRLNGFFCIFRVFCCCFFEPQTTQTDAKIIYDSRCCKLLFLRISASSVVDSSSPIQELEPGATPYRGGRCAARYPRGLQAA